MKVHREKYDLPCCWHELVYFLLIGKYEVTICNLLHFLHIIFQLWRLLNAIKVVIVKFHDCVMYKIALN